jgi:serine/threonine protein kinase
VLVKIDGQLCIADLGLAVRYKDGVLDMSVNNKAGTVRYLPPELLDESMPIKFDAFRAADVYAMGLIVWEMVTRTRIDNIGSIDGKIFVYDVISNAMTSSSIM